MHLLIPKSYKLHTRGVGEGGGSKEAAGGGEERGWQQDEQQSDFTAISRHFQHNVLL